MIDITLYSIELYIMNCKTLSITTSDGETVQYPRNFLVSKCKTIKNALSLDGNDCITIPFTLKELDIFLEYLQCFEPLETVEETHIALKVADYLELHVPKFDLYFLLEILENSQQCDEFLKSEGFNDISLESILYLYENRDLLSSFVGKTRDERFTALSDWIKCKEGANFNELMKMIEYTCPNFIKRLLLQLDFSDEIIP